MNSRNNSIKQEDLTILVTRAAGTLYQASQALKRLAEVTQELPWNSTCIPKLAITDALGSVNAWLQESMTHLDMLGELGEIWPIKVIPAEKQPGSTAPSRPPKDEEPPVPPKPLSAIAQALSNTEPEEPPSDMADGGGYSLDQYVKGGPKV